MRLKNRNPPFTILCSSMLAFLIMLQTTTGSETTVTIDAGGQPRAQANLQVSLESMSNEFRFPDLVTFRLSIRNEGNNCFPIYISPWILPYASEGINLAAIQIEFMDRNGEVQTPRDGSFADYPAFNPANFMLLDCGSHYGRIIEAYGYFDRDNVSKKGHYRARVRLHLQTKSFLDFNHDILDRLIQIEGADKGQILARSFDFIGESNWVEFAVNEDLPQPETQNK